MPAVALIRGYSIHVPVPVVRHIRSLRMPTSTPTAPTHSQPHPHPRLELPHVGKLRAMTIGHNNKGEGPDWHLLMVEVREELDGTDGELGPITRFVCNKWIGLGHPDPDSGSEEGVLQRTLKPGGEDPRLEMTDYRVGGWKEGRTGGYVPEPNERVPWGAQFKTAIKG